MKQKTKDIISLSCIVFLSILTIIAIITAIIIDNWDKACFYLLMYNTLMFVTRNYQI